MPRYRVVTNKGDFIVYTTSKRKAAKFIKRRFDDRIIFDVRKENK